MLSSLGNNPLEVKFQDDKVYQELELFSSKLLNETQLIAKSLCNTKKVPDKYTKLSSYENIDPKEMTESIYYYAPQKLLLSIGSFGLNYTNTTWIEIQNQKDKNLKSSKIYMNNDSCTLLDLSTKIGSINSKHLEDTFDLNVGTLAKKSEKTKIIVGVIEGETFYFDHKNFEGKWFVDSSGKIITPSTQFSKTYRSFYGPAHPNWVLDSLLKNTENVLILPIQTFLPDIIGFTSPVEPFYDHEAGENFIKILNSKQYDDIQFAISNGATIFNLSFGAFYGFQSFTSFNGKNVSWKKVLPPGSFDGYKNAMINFKDIIFITSAGNEGVDLDLEKNYWISNTLDNQIVVGASDILGQLWANSNYGKIIDFTALGVDVETIAEQNFDKTTGLYIYPDKDNSKLIVSGTSFAAPYVARVIAKVKQLRPDLVQTPKLIKDFLCRNVIPHPSLKETTRCGGYISEKHILSLL